MALEEMGRAQGVSKDVIKRWMEENDIPLRNVRGPQKKLVKHVKPGMFNPNDKNYFI